MCISCKGRIPWFQCKPENERFNESIFTIVNSKLSALHKPLSRFKLMNLCMSHSLVYSKFPQFILVFNLKTKK